MTTQRYIVSHTSIRGIAALLVVFYHLQFGAPVKFSWETATPFFRVGYLWVDLFFILSGFVISYSARTDERAPFDWPQVKSFWLLRFARIYPLHVFCLLVMLVEALGETAVGLVLHKQMVPPDLWSAGSILHFFEQLFLLNGWGLTGRSGWNIPSWSISTEVVAYLLFPAVAAFMVKGGRSAIAAMGFASVCFYAWVAATTGVLDITQGAAVLRCLSGFSLGMILYATRAQFDRLPDSVLGLLQAIGALLAIGTPLLGLNDVAAIPGFFLLVAATWPDRGWLARPLRTRVMHWLGEISYSVYLNHFWVLGAWHFVMTRVLKLLGASPLASRAVILAGGVALVLAVSHVTYRTIEGPARKAITRWTKSRSATRMPPLQAEKTAT
jgi:peptidoglycan/LPS O-acetylase OafA/YrhL